MIYSMTGFGDASAEVEGVHYSVSLHSLNNRYFKATVRLPEELGEMEAALETLLRKRLWRGSVSLCVKKRYLGGAGAYQVNDAAMMAYLDHLETLQARFSSPDRSLTIDLTALLALPGVLQPIDSEESVIEKAREVVIGLTEEACKKLAQMRVNEGRLIAEDLARQGGVIRERLEQIAVRGPEVVEEYHRRLRARIDELLAKAQLKVDEKDLIHEVAVFADRADISEEVSRMRGHLEQIEQIMEANDGQPAGRTLDFLAQELLREANTIASKSGDAMISRAVVDMKSAIDRMKEQAQNVE